jgi:hypothetical protein
MPTWLQLANFITAVASHVVAIIALFGACRMTVTAKAVRQHLESASRIGNFV